MGKGVENYGCIVAQMHLVMVGYVLSFSSKMINLLQVNQDTTAMQQPKGLNEVQLSLLRLFNRPMSYEESVEIRDLLVRHYAEKLFDEVDKVVIEKNISVVDYEKLRNQHQLT